MNEVVAEELAELALELHDQSSLHGCVQHVVEHAIAAVGCDCASLIFVHRSGRIETMASTDPVAEKIAQLLAKHGEGPALSLQAEPGSHLVVHDAANEPRWPQWSRDLVALGVHSVLSIRLATHASLIGALTLYAQPPLRFDKDDVEVASILARHVSVALANARREYAYVQEIETGKRIGQAQGMLMERFRLTPEQALELLSRYSQHRGIKLLDVARQLAACRDLPSDDIAGDLHDPDRT
jgi:GAF domain-containing protein